MNDNLGVVSIDKSIFKEYTVKSRKSRTLFINYDFCWLMVAGILRKQRSKLRHRGRNSPTSSIETEARWKIAIAYFVQKNTIFPHKILIVHLPELSFLCYIY